MHPWALGAPPQGRVIGWIEPSFHERFAWNEARWQFVLARMREACDGIVVGDAPAITRKRRYAPLGSLPFMIFALNGVMARIDRSLLQAAARLGARGNVKSELLFHVFRSP